MLKAFDVAAYPVAFTNIQRWYICPASKYCFIHGYDDEGVVVKIPTWINKLAHILFTDKAKSLYYVRKVSAKKKDFKTLRGIVIDFTPESGWSFSVAEDGIYLSFESISYRLPEELQTLLGEVQLFSNEVNNERKEVGERVIAAYREPLGMSQIEALSLSIPVLASNTGGIPETIRHGETGILVEPGNMDAWERALDQALSNREASRRMAEHGAMDVRTRFSVESNLQGILALLHNHAATPP
jgi:glycosyltransferase involved in cell wall biosynthesis